MSAQDECTYETVQVQQDCAEARDSGLKNAAPCIRR